MRCGCSDAVVDSMWERLVAGWGVVPNVVSYNTLLKRYLSPARPAAGKAAARGGGSNGGRSGDSGGGSVARSPLVAAMALVMQMRGAGVRPDDFTYNTLVGIATRQRDMAAAEALVAEMTAVGLRPTPHTLSTLLQGYGALGAVDKALACYEAARRAGGDPNPVARKVLAEACIAGGDPAAAVTVMTELLRSDGGAHADVVACNVLLKALRELGDLDASLRLLSDMPSMGPPGAGGLRPDEVTYNTIVDACCRRGRVALAESVVETMRAAGIAPTATTLNPFIRGHLRRDPPSLDGALAVPAAMEAAGVRPDAFTAALLVAACVQMERPLEGVRRFAALRAAGARMSAISYTVMLRAAAAAVPAAAASPEGAIEAAEAAVMLGVPRLAAAAAAEGGSDSSGSSGDSSGDSSGELRGIGGAPEQSSDSCGGSDGAHLLVVAAENSVADMRAAGVAPLRSNFNALVAVAAAARDMPLARRAWEHMGAAGIAADAFSYGEFVRCCVAADEPAAGVAAVDEAVAEGVQVPLLTFATLIRSFGAVGDVQAADAVFERFKLVGAAARAAAAGAGAALISGGGFGGGVNGTAASDFNRASVVNDVATASGINGAAAASGVNGAAAASGVNGAAAASGVNGAAAASGVSGAAVGAENGAATAGDAWQQETVVVWNALMAAYISCRCTGTAVDTFAAMVSEGVRPDARSYDALARAHCHAGNLVAAATALESLYELEAAAAAAAAAKAAASEAMAVTAAVVTAGVAGSGVGPAAGAEAAGGDASVAALAVAPQSGGGGGGSSGSGGATREVVQRLIEAGDVAVLSRLLGRLKALSVRLDPETESAASAALLRLGAGRLKTVTSRLSGVIGGAYKNR